MPVEVDLAVDRFVRDRFQQLSRHVGTPVGHMNVENWVRRERRLA